MIVKKITTPNNCIYCAMPLILDTYNVCEFDCSYCYSKVLYKRMNNLIKENKIVKVKKYKKKFPFPIRIGILTDPFIKEDVFIRNTLKTMLNLLENNNNIYLSTKSIIIKEVELYIKIFEKYKEQIVLKMSFSCFNEKIREKIEKNCYKIKDRLETLKFYKELGIKTILRLQPYLFEYSDIDFFETIEKYKYYIDRITIEPLRIALCGANKNIIFNDLGITLEDFYKDKKRKDNKNIGHLNFIDYDPYFLRDKYLKIKEFVNKNNILFGICGLSYGFENILLNDGDFCCQVNDWNYDKTALVPLFKQNRVNELDYIGEMKYKDLVFNSDKQIELDLLKYYTIKNELVIK